MYKDYFKLKCRPFGLSPEQKFFFNNASQRHAFESLNEGLKHGEGIISFSGEAGTGKTTLALSLKRVMAKTSVITAFIQNTQLGPEDMLRYTISQLGLPYENLSKIDLLKVLDGFFEDCRRKNKRILLLIDESHNLTRVALEEMRMMLNLFEGKKSILQYVMFGQPRFFEDTIPESAIRPLVQKIVASAQLTCMDHDETAMYIHHRLKIAGWNSNPRISAGAYSLIYDHTLGNPAEINMICMKLLDAAACVHSNKIDSKLTQWVIQEIANQHIGVDFTGTILENLVDNKVSEEPATAAESGLDINKILTEKVDFSNEEKELEVPAIEGNGNDGDQTAKKKQDNKNKQKKAEVEKTKQGQKPETMMDIFNEGADETQVEEIVY